MPARYSVIQYIPDPITDERINIGVIAFDQENVRVRFLSKWERVRAFANQDIQFLKTFANEFAKAASPQLLMISKDNNRIDSKQIEQIAAGWINTIQLTTPRSSIKTVDSLLNDIASLFLSEPIRNRRGFRDKRAAASLAKSQIREALIERVGSNEAEELLKQQASLQGKFKGHVFDAVVSNGVPYFAAHGMSFELPEASNLSLQIDAISWAIADVREYDKSLPIGLMTLPPLSTSEEHGRLQELYEGAIKIYKGLGAAVLTEENVKEWAEQMVKRVPV